MRTQTPDSFKIPARPVGRPGESGQAIVIIAMVMVGLIAMLGLAIDGGGMFYLWRTARTAADASVLASAYARCTEGDPMFAGYNAANSNGFNNNGADNTVTINNPPLTGEGANNPDYTEVIIEAEKPAYFIQIVYNGPLLIRARATGFCRPRFNPAQIPGLWAGSTSCQDTVNWTGSSAYIEGGLFSNNEIKLTGSNADMGPGPVEAAGNVQTSNSGNVNWADGYPPTSGVDVRSDPMAFDVRLYQPGGLIASNVSLYKAIRSSADDPDYRTQGNSTGWSPANGRVLEGLYYVEGNVDIGVNVQFGAQGVTIIATGEIQLRTNANKNANNGDPATPIRYYSEVMNLVGDGVRYPGYLFISLIDQSSNCRADALKVSANKVTLHGVIYAPRGGVAVSGASIEFQGVLVAQTIDYSGSSGRLIYEAALMPPRPPVIYVVE